MELNNILAKLIETAGVNSAYDEACKCVLANKQILAWIVKSCIEEFNEYRIEDITEKYIEGEPNVADVAVHRDEGSEFITGNNTEDTTMTEGTVYYDIRFYVILPTTQEMTKLIINVESQNKFYPGYPLVKRGIYYSSRMVSA